VKSALANAAGDRVKSFESRGWDYIQIHQKIRVITHIDLGGRYNLSYHHNIVDVDGQLLGEFISVCSWLGISSQTQWDAMLPNEEQLASKSVAGLCRHFLAALPQIVDGVA
jgi:hypothetical protein